MIELKNDKLVFRFPEVHGNAVCEIDFQRTLRIPDDNREYSLPPGLGRFPIEHVEDHTSRLPKEWTEHGGVLLPMYQSEALWINFSARNGYPFAIKIAAGKINAVTGDEWNNSLVKSPQNYITVPGQPWLDGFCVQEGQIRQFVAMPLGDGYTAEEQITGEAEHGGIQVIAYPMKLERYKEILSRREQESIVFGSNYSMRIEIGYDYDMGLAPGGLMRQAISEDKYGYDAWDTTVSSRCFVHILNSSQWVEGTGKPVPGKPPTAKNYTDAGLPWFTYYDDNIGALGGAEKLGNLDSVAAKGIKLGENPLPENKSVQPENTVSLCPKTIKVNEGKW